MNKRYDYGSNGLLIKVQVKHNNTTYSTTIDIDIVAN